MPIDYLSRKQQLEKETQDLLASQKAAIPGQLDITRQNLAGGRDTFFKDTLGNVVAGLLSSIPMVTPDTSRAKAILSRNADVALAGQGRTQGVDLMSKTFDLAVQIAQHYGYSRRKAEEFATQYVQDEADRKRRGEAATTEINQGRKLLDIGDMFSNRGIDLANQYQYNPDYGPYALGAGLNVATLLGTSYLLGRNNTINPLKGKLPLQTGMSSLRGNTEFSSQIDPITGQRKAQYGTGF